VYELRPVGAFEEVKGLVEAGLSDYAIARRTGIPRSTVQHWRRRSVPPAGGRRQAREFEVLDPDSYAYLLGAYLGDGTIWATGPRTWRMAVSCDAAYPEIIREIGAAITRCDPATAVRFNRRSGANVVVIRASSPWWGVAFPHLGAGHKHQRAIRLKRWQREITGARPEPLLRGLIHSDGCRTENRFQTKLPSGRVATYAYPRYFFTNHSADIRGIFCEHCDLLGIRWTQSNHRNISIADRDSVAVLDSFVGPKR
jgi:hypothetical protein